MRILILLALLTVLVAAYAEELVDELTVNDDGEELVVRQARAAKGRGGKIKNANKAKECRYTKGAWGECSPTNNQRTRTLTLKKGDDSACEATRTEAKKCKRMCRYAKGQWSDCIGGTNQMERIDTLKQGSDASCEPTQKKIKKCKAPCEYERTSVWSACDSGTRTRTRNLIKGDPNVCEPSKTSRKSCKTRNGKDRCFYGTWSEWSECKNGRQVKTRPVMSGGAHCQRKASKTKECKGVQS